MAAIPDRVWNLLTDDERDALRAIVDGWRHEPVVVCPKCQSTIGVKLKVTATCRLVGETDAPVTAATFTSNRERDLIESAERTGLMKAFVSAVHQAKGTTGVPSDMNQFFLQFFRMAVAKKVPQFAIDRFNREFKGRLTFWSAQGVLAVSVDGIIRMFVPVSYIVGAPIASITTKGMAGRLQADEQELEVWIKGRFGYVPMGSENYMDALRRKNIGQFGALVQ